ncbi:CU044_2847 family protein [Kitasatospora sp. NPDC004615]|uniref:CU044_2847 family protein n=1 Tax=Kitasatospora sp. NPDC004615 TaxID=3364017 RepID=UPI0036A86424
MSDYTEVTLPDGTAVLLQVFDLRRADQESGDPDLPDGSGDVVPVGRVRDAARTTGEALREALQPLGGVLDLVHGAVRSAIKPPDEVEVEFGVKLSKDLRLGIVSAGGEAALKVRAKWQTGRAAEIPAQPDGATEQEAAAAAR